jgi:hypothetical protein
MNFFTFHSDMKPCDTKKTDDNPKKKNDVKT